MVKTPETMAIEVMRLIQLASCREEIARIEVTVPFDVADYHAQPRPAGRWSSSRSRAR